MASWLNWRLQCAVERRTVGSSGMRSVVLERANGPISLDRPDGRTATLRQEGEPDHFISLPRRSVATCLAEELRRLDPDEVYGEVIARHSTIAV